MRIISGKAGGIRLQAPIGRQLRPTEERVKESMFSSLGDLTGQVVVDLFAGTGALGLEAWSRGAAKVFLVEKQREHIDCIKSNLQAVAKAMQKPVDDTSIHVLQADVRQIDTLLAATRPDVILADPPYLAKGQTDAFGAASLLQHAGFSAWAGADCLLVLEHAAAAALPWYPETCWQLLKSKRFGIRALAYARQQSPENS